MCIYDSRYVYTYFHSGTHKVYLFESPTFVRVESPRSVYLMHDVCTFHSCTYEVYKLESPRSVYVESPRSVYMMHDVCTYYHSCTYKVYLLESPRYVHTCFHVHIRYIYQNLLDLFPFMYTSGIGCFCQ